MMTDKSAFLEYNKFKAAIAVTISLGVLLLSLLPASLGFGGTIIQEAFGQFALPQLEEPEEDTTTTTTTPPTTPTTPTTPPATTNYTNNIQDPSIFLLRGFIGSTLPAQGAIGGGGAITPAANDDSGYVVTGRFRVFANETLVRRFIAEMNVVAIDGSSSFNNITITESAPHRFQVTEGSNGTTTTTSVPVVSSNLLGTIYLDGGATPVIDNVPMTLTVRGQSLAIQGIDIDESRIADTGQRDTISVIDGQSIYGIVPR
jgi:cell wall-associated NlpC family hydrolase